MFGAWAVWDKHFSKDTSNVAVSTITQSVSYSFDNLFHWIACFIYLKAALVLPYLFDKNFYSDNAEILKNYNTTQTKLKWVNWLNNSVIALGFIAVIPMMWT